MDKLNVLVVSGAELYQGYLENIAAVDVRISVKEGVRQFIDELRSKKKTGSAVNELEYEASLWSNKQISQGQESLDRLLAEAEVILGRLILPDNLISRAPKLKWLHIQGAGIDLLLSTGILDSNIMVTNGRGVRATTIAEHAVGFIFMLAKNAPRLLSNKQTKKWERFLTMDLHRSTVGIIGLGAVGSEVARMAKGIGMRVIATKKSAAKRESGTMGVDELYPNSELVQLLSDSDFVVLSAPLTEETRGMIGEKELRTMKSTAYLINIARGKIINQPVLIKALKEGWIAGAGLDVFEIEPLPPDSELWKLPNVIVSPHMSGFTGKGGRHEVALFCENLKKYLAGEKLLNVVNREKKY